MKVCFWDLETTDLSAKWARILTSSILAENADKPVTFINEALRNGPMRGRSNDLQLLLKTRETLEKFDIVVTYYGGPRRFDLPVLNTRLLIYNKRPLMPMFHLDLYSVVKDKLGLRDGQRSLHSVAEMFGFPCATNATPDSWLKAALEGDKKAFDYVVKHNEEDVFATRVVFNKLWPMVKQLRRV